MNKEYFDKIGHRFVTDKNDLPKSPDLDAFSLELRMLMEKHGIQTYLCGVLKGNKGSFIRQGHPTSIITMAKGFIETETIEYSGGKA